MQQKLKKMQMQQMNRIILLLSPLEPFQTQNRKRGLILIQNSVLEADKEDNQHPDHQPVVSNGFSLISTQLQQPQQPQPRQQRPQPQPKQQPKQYQQHPQKLQQPQQQPQQQPPRRPKPLQQPQPLRIHFGKLY